MRARACEFARCAQENPSPFSSADIRRLKAVVQDRNASQKHVWRAEIVLLTAVASARTRSCGERTSPRPAFGAGRNAF